MKTNNPFPNTNPKPAGGGQKTAEPGASDRPVVPENARVQFFYNKTIGAIEEVSQKKAVSNFVRWFVTQSGWDAMCYMPKIVCTFKLKSK